MIIVCHRNRSKGQGRSVPVGVVYILCFTAEMLSVVYGGPAEVRLINDLLANYSKYERPATVDNTPLTVEFTMTLQQIIDLDEKNQLISTNIWITMQWTDYKLRWNPEEYENVTEIRLPPTILWKPDILMYNSADQKFDGTWPVNIVVQSTGVISQIPPGIFTSSCPIDIKWFPFDEQSCELKFGSWTYDGTKIDLWTLGNASSGSTDGYRRSGEWDLLGVPAVRNVVLYDCCPDNPYIDLTFYIKIKRRKLYYLVNIVLPCVMLSALTLLTFAIPADAGEKVSFGVTILLSLTVFLLLVAETLPATSDAVPLIAIYFSLVMLMNAVSVVFTALVLSYHHRNATTHTMPSWVRKGICQWLAWFLKVERPERKLEYRNPLSHRVSVELNDFGCNANSRLLASYRESDFTPSAESSPQLNIHDCNRHLKGTHRALTNGIEAAKLCAEFSPTRLELRNIIKELRVITDKVKKQQEDDYITADWKFAARVLDRFLLWVFFLLVLVCSCAVLLPVPGIFKPEGGIE